MFGLGIQELIIVGVVAVILFGKRLPEVARSVGTSYRDFRRGLTEIQSQMDFSDVYRHTTPSNSITSKSLVDDDDDYDKPTAPRFELPPSPESSSEVPENRLD